MKLAPLQLIDYHAHQLSVNSNTHYQADSGKHSTAGNVNVEHKIEQLQLPDDAQDEATIWQVDLTVSQSEKGKDVPYIYSIHLTGLILAQSSIPEDRLETIIRANGTAMLFGVAREMIRTMTAMGPFPAVILPSTNFLPTKPKQRSVAMKKANSSKKKTTTKKAAKKKTK